MSLLESFQESKLSLHRHVRNYFLKNKSLGSKDRQVISNSLYQIVRWKNFFSYFCKDKSVTWKDIFDVSERINPLTDVTPMPDWDKVSFPLWLYKKIIRSLGPDVGIDVCYTLNTQAPVTIRINPIKTTRENFLATLGSNYNLKPCANSPLGIHILQKISIQSIPLFNEGYFEVQDEGSQLMSDLVKPNPEDIVLDYCAGSGGKSLAFGPRMKNKGKIYLYDTRKSILSKAKKRLLKAGINNIKFFNPSINVQYDWIVLDVPCSGTGTIRRQPELKWSLSNQKIAGYCDLQRTIFDTVWGYLKQNGKLVYITCSILQEENEDQIAFFIKKYSMQIVEKIALLPTRDSHDGFFGVVLKKV
ncbi:MAG: RsmB/NOP family class I SAM-dependent RNA methyltransferase [Chlamydiales bacterium]